MKIIKDQKIVDDTWQTVEDDIDLSNLPNDNIIVTLKTWKAAKEALVACGNNLGVKLSSGELISEIADDLSHFGLVALDFQPYKDGRHFSTARLLRERHNFKGEIRATGNVLRDQLLYMQRVGFDAFELGPNQDPEAALSAFHDLSTAYQPTADLQPPIYQRK